MFCVADMLTKRTLILERGRRVVHADLKANQESEVNEGVGEVEGAFEWIIDDG